MNKLLEKFNNLKKREKVLLVVSLIVAASLLVNKIIITPVFSSLNEVTEKYNSKHLLLSKYHEFMANEEEYSGKLESLEDEFKILEKKILKFETEELASAKLQELVKTIAKRNGLSISRSFGGKNSVITEDPYLVAISANFEINDVNQVKKLRTFLYDLECNKDKLFFVNDIKVKGVGINTITNISFSTTLSIIASIKKK